MSKKIGIVIFVVMLPLWVSCNKYLRGDCLIKLSFSDEYESILQEPVFKGGEKEIPDTNDFILTIENSDGEKIYQGAYKNKPSKIAVNEGDYKVKVYSAKFEVPAFASPQYGDSCYVSAKSGTSATVLFRCRQLNSGIRLRYSAEFKTRFASSKVLLIEGGEELEYTYAEERIAYFHPGRVEVRMETDGKRRLLFSKELSSEEVMTVNMSVAAEEMTEADMRIIVDTARVWTIYNYEYGAGNDGSTIGKAFSVAEAMPMVGEEDVWVRGYIVGACSGTKRVEFSNSCTKETNIVIADNPQEKDAERCIAVELASDKMRDSLKMTGGSPNYLKMVYLKGTIESSYFGIVGLKKIKEYRLKK